MTYPQTSKLDSQRRALLRNFPIFPGEPEFSLQLYQESGAQELSSLWRARELSRWTLQQNAILIFLNVAFSKNSEYTHGVLVFHSQISDSDRFWKYLFHIHKNFIEICWKCDFLRSVLGAFLENSPLQQTWRVCGALSKFSPEISGKWRVGEHSENFWSVY